jgi:hypothetical protein
MKIQEDDIRKARDEDLDKIGKLHISHDEKLIRAKKIIELYKPYHLRTEIYPKELEEMRSIREEIMRVEHKKIHETVTKPKNMVKKKRKQ